MSTIYASAGGSAVVSTDSGASITYIDSGAVVGTTSTTDNSKVKVHVPITNPQSTTDKLSKVSVECDSSSSATVDEIWVYYGKTQILDENVTAGSKDFDIKTTSTSAQADSAPYGIDVTMEISFPSTAGTLTIYSVTLSFDVSN